MAYLNFDRTKLINLEYSLKRELIRTNRAGSYACSTIIDCNTRKYHGLLICPLPLLDGGRHVLLSAFHETIVENDQEFNLGMHKYAADHYEPKGHKYITDFTADPIPKLVYQVGNLVLSKEKILVENESKLLIKYTLTEAHSIVKIRFKPFLAFRNIHALSKANMDANTKCNEVKNGVSAKLYEGYPDLYMQFSRKVEFVHAPDWYYNIEYQEDQKRGYDYKEDLFVPGFFEISLSKGESVVFSCSLKESNPSLLKNQFSNEVARRIPRNDFNNCMLNTVQQFFIYDKKNVYIIAGYPWLSIRTRDMLIALPGLTLPLNDIELSKKIINSVIANLDGHLLPDILENNQPKNYPADIPLWLIWCIQQIEALYPYENIWNEYSKQIISIIKGYLNEKNHFRIAENGLIFIDRLKTNASWMNAEIHSQPLVKRLGFKVETNALWYNAIAYISDHETGNSEIKFFKKLASLKAQIETSFTKVFWNESTGYFNDYVTDKEINIQIRPNPIFAASLPYSPLSKHHIKSVIEVVNQHLLTTYGIRSLAPSDADYVPYYQGNHYEREKAAFNGSVWPWLFTHYIEASMKINPKSAVSMAKNFLKIFEDDVASLGICSISELYHADPPQKPKGAISFAINTGELIRLKTIIEKEIGY